MCALSTKIQERTYVPRGEGSACLLAGCRTRSRQAGRKVPRLPGKSSALPPRLEAWLLVRCTHPARNRRTATVCHIHTVGPLFIVWPLPCTRLALAYCLYPRSDDPSLARPPPVAPPLFIILFIYSQYLAICLLRCLLGCWLSLSLSHVSFICLTHLRSPSRSQTN